MYVLIGIIVCAVETVVAANVAQADGTDVFDSFSAAVKCFSDMFSTDGIWPVVSRGGSSMFISNTVTYDHLGDVARFFWYDYGVPCRGLQGDIHLWI